MTPTAPPLRSDRSHHVLRLACALAVLAPAACATDGEPAPVGALDVTWIFGPSSCEEADLSRVEIELDGALVREAACEEGGVIVEDLEPGTRQLQLRGLDLGGVERFAATPRTVSIVADEVTAQNDVLLSALPARVDVTWYFTNGRLCSTNAVDEVELSVWRDGFLEGATEAACDDGSASIAGLSSGTFVVELRAIDGRGDAITTAESEVVLGKGDRRELDVPLAVEAD